MKPVDTLVDTFDLEASTQKFHFVGNRMRQAREHLGLSQQELANKIGVSKRGIQDNETRNRVPGGEVIHGFVGLGINANWLLTSDGPMLLADLQAPAAPSAAQVNGELLQHVVDMFYGFLAENKDHLRINQKCHGAAIALLYKLALSSNRVSKEDVRQVLALAA